MIPGMRSVINLNPEHASAHRELARDLQRNGQLDEALEESRLAMRLGPTDEAALRLHGEIVSEINKRAALVEEQRPKPERKDSQSISFQDWEKRDASEQISSSKHLNTMEAEKFDEAWRDGVRSSMRLSMAGRR
jgi:hypothetical protein